jgi:hypothetical protein
MTQRGEGGRSHSRQRIAGVECCRTLVLKGRVERRIFPGDAGIVSEVGQRAGGLALAGPLLLVVGGLNAVTVLVRRWTAVGGPTLKGGRPMSVTHVAGREHTRRSQAVWGYMSRDHRLLINQLSHTRID